MIEVDRINGMALCAGIGGLELGLKLALGKTFNTCVYVEWETYAASVLVSRMQDKTLDQAPIWDDITTFDSTAWRGSIDIISSGFPCQPWSKAGKGFGTTDKRWLWSYIKKAICNVQPGYIFLENVGQITAGALDKILWDMASFGYDAEWTMLSSKQIGFPHKRERIFILGYSSKYASCKLPICTQQQRDNWSETKYFGEGSLPLFPPGPTDNWEHIRNDFKPVVRRMVDGVPYELDRLQAIGNSVSPVVAAMAFIHLYSRILK